MTKNAFTLIEVVVGLVLLASLLVSLLLANARHQRLLRLAENRHAAAVVADELLASWYDSPTGTPPNSGGPIVGQPNWSWRTYVTSNRTIFGRTLPVVTLEILEQTGRTQPTKLVSIETVYVASSGEAFR